MRLDYLKVKVQGKLFRWDGITLCNKINNLFRADGIKVGSKCRIYSDIRTSESYLIEIGNNVSISTEVLFLTHDNSVIKFCENATDIFGKIEIGDNCFIGARATILPGVKLADSIVVGAGSVVTKSFTEAGSIIAGNPAKIIGNIDNKREVLQKKCFNIENMTAREKRNAIQQHSERIIKK